LWLKKYNKDALAQPDEATKEVFKRGDEVGELACKLFPNGIKVEFDGDDFNRMINKTQNLIDIGVRNIYEASFNYNGIFVAVDILHINDDNSVEIYEVKSSTWSPKKTTKDFQKYIDDISIQYYVLKSCGYSISKANLVVLDSTYKREKELEIAKLFKVLDFTNEVVNLQDDIPVRLEEFKSILSDTQNEPSVKIGTHCLKPYECDAIDYCWNKQEEIPSPNIFDLLPRTDKNFELFHSGIKSLKDLKKSNINLTDKQQQKINLLLDNQVYIDKISIKKFLDDLTYPLYYLDFETFQQAIPMFQGVSPFMHISFQYSLHIEQSDGSLKHREFLAKCEDDPREKIVKRLVEDIPKNATVVAYHTQFERDRLKELALSFPKYSKHLLNIADNLIDLEIPFKNKDYYVPAMKGKSSIKVVLPALVPEFESAYKELELVQNGSDAMNVYPNLINMAQEQKDRYRYALLKYCELDTLAMVKVLEKLRDSTE
jgi:hypothetical protein